MNTTKKKPATALPWLSDAYGLFGAKGSIPDGAFTDAPTETSKADAAYIAHACNAYPELVAKLKRCQAALRANGAPNCEAMKESTALLAKLGEA